MNKSRITQALDHIDELIALAFRELDNHQSSRVQAARESLDYLRFIMEAYTKESVHIEDIAERVDGIHASLRCIEREIDREPDYIPVSLGP